MNCQASYLTILTWALCQIVHASKPALSSLRVSHPLDKFLITAIDIDLNFSTTQAEKDQVNADEKLEDLFGQKLFNMSDLPQLIELRAFPSKPFCIPYILR